MFKRNYLVIYDISNDKNRRKIVKSLETYGYRVQYSAFECALNLRTKKILIKELEKIMLKGDSVRIYKLPASVYIVGKGEESYENEPEFLFIY
ncbi:MAG: CRISPR-associated endonuclease Cas2 [Ruminococcus sp.]|nr:CRISPR-associated endonuclease Cas2 [Ruminococcus sp.]